MYCAWRLLCKESKKKIVEQDSYERKGDIEKYKRRAQNGRIIPMQTGRRAPFKRYTFIKIKYWTRHLFFYRLYA